MVEELAHFRHIGRCLDGSPDADAGLEADCVALCSQPYLQCIVLLFLLRWLEMRYGGRGLKDNRLCRWPQIAPYELTVGWLDKRESIPVQAKINVKDLRQSLGPPLKMNKPLR